MVRDIQCDVLRIGAEVPECSGRNKKFGKKDPQDSTRVRGSEQIVGINENSKHRETNNLEWIPPMKDKLCRTND